MKKKLTIMLILALIICTMPVMAKPRNGRYIDKAGHVYIMKNGKPRTGYFKYKGKWYYGHKTGTNVYPKGSVTAGDMRIKNGKWYAYGVDGARITKDVYVRKGRTKKILQLDIRHRNGTVRYIYGTARGNLGSRYSTKLGRMQYMDDKGKWHDVEGMPFYPGYVDMQR